MQNRLEYTLNTTRKIYFFDNESFSDFYDITLSIIAWNLLSDIRVKIPNIKNKISDKYSFSSVLEKVNFNKSDIYSSIDKALYYWDNLLQKKGKYQFTLLKWDDVISENLSENDWYRILRLWEEFFNIFPSHNQDTLFELWEFIEKYFVTAYSNENVHLAPATVISTMTQYLTSEDKKISVYDPYSRTGNLLAEIQRSVPGVQEMTGISSARLSLKLATIRLLFTDVRSSIYLSNPDKNVDDKNMFDIILSNPPYGDNRNNMKISVQDKYLGTIARKSKRMEVIFLSHILDRLATDGRAAVLLPRIFLTGGSSVKDLMEYIIHQNILDVVVELPQGLFEHTAIAPVIFCFNKKRKVDKGIILINAINEVHKSGRQLYLNEKTLSSWLQQIRDRNIPNEKNIIQVNPHEVITVDYNLYELLHRYEKETNKEHKSTTQLLAESEQLQDSLVSIQQEIVVLIQNYNK